MSQKKQKPGEFVAKLRQVDILVSQGRSVSEAVRAISVTPTICPPMARKPLARRVASKRTNSASTAPARLSASQKVQIVFASGTGSASARTA